MKLIYTSILLLSGLLVNAQNNFVLVYKDYQYNQIKKVPIKKANTFQYSCRNRNDNSLSKQSPDLRLSEAQQQDATGEIHGWLNRSYEKPRDSDYYNKCQIYINTYPYIAPVDSFGNFYFNNLSAGTYFVNLIIDNVVYRKVTDIQVRESHISFVNEFNNEFHYRSKMAALLMQAYKNEPIDTFCYPWKKNMISISEYTEPCKIAGRVDYQKIVDQLVNKEWEDETRSRLEEQGSKPEDIKLHLSQIPKRPVPDTKIFDIYLQRNGKKYTTQTDTSGYFIIDSLPVGFYTATFKLSHYYGVTYHGIVARPDSVAYVSMDEIEKPINNSLILIKPPDRQIFYGYKWEKKYLILNSF